MRKKCLKQLLHSVQAKYIHHTKKPKQIYCEGEREVNKQKTICNLLSPLSSNEEFTSINLK